MGGIFGDPNSFANRFSAGMAAGKEPELWAKQREVAKYEQLRQDMAPLTQAIQATQTQLQSLPRDEQTGQVLPEYQQRHNDLVDQMSTIIDKKRQLLYPPPKEDPHGLGYLVHKATDKLHITNNAVNEAKKVQLQKVYNYDQAGRDETQTAVQGVTPEVNPYAHEMSQLGQAGFTPEEQHAAISQKVIPLKTDQDRFIADHMARNPGETREDAVKAYFTASTRESSDTRWRADYDADPDPHKGTPEAWRARQASLGRVSVPKAKNDKDRYTELNAKMAMGTPLTPEESAFRKGFEQTIKATAIDPRVAAYTALGAARYSDFVDPDNPDRIIALPYGVGSRMGLARPNSVAYQAGLTAGRQMVPRNLGQNLASFGTAMDHLNMLEDMGNALQNGDVQALNSISQSWSQATGDAAPMNFDMVKTSLEGELARAFSGVGATQKEQERIGAEISRANSPEQLLGVVGTARETLKRRSENLLKQVDAAKNPKGPGAKALEDIKGTGGKVKMKAPNGAISSVDQKDVAHYKSLGAVVVE